MKKILSLFSVLAVLSVFVACQKEPPIPVSDIELKEDSVRCYINDTLVSAVFSGTVRYEGVIDSLTLRIGTDSLLNNGTAKAYPVNIINDETFALTVDSLQDSTVYFYRYCVDYGMKDVYETETRSFTTPTITVLNLPVVSAVVVDSLSITTNSAVVYSEVVEDGDYEVVERGFCYAEHLDPTIEDNLLICGEGIGFFSDTITGLSQNTLYYVRAYAIYNEGTVYSESRSFLTLLNPLPTVETLGVFNITATSATGKGQVTHEGAAPVKDCGVCWSENPEPTVDDNFASSGSGGLQTFSVLMTGLKEGVTYYVRAYALNDNGFAYGEEVHFMATDGLPIVVTTEPSQITTNTADCGGEVTSDGGNEVIERGLYWSTQASLAQYDSIVCGTGMGSFTHTLADLKPSTTYYVCAYAKNSKGTSRGEVRPFVTNQEVTEPVVETLSVTQSSIVLKVKGIVKEDGGSPVIERGVCYSLDPSVNINHQSISSYPAGLGEFIVNVGITLGKTYYIRAYAKNSEKIGYGEVIQVNTTIVVPVVTIPEINNITQNSAIVSGKVSDAGGGLISMTGVCWGTEHNPTISGSHQSISGALDSFTVHIRNLDPGTIYYVRAYAKNEAGLGYSEERMFVTEAIPVALPTVQTHDIDTASVTTTTALCEGEVMSDGGSTVTGRGICYSMDSTNYGSHVPCVDPDVNSIAVNLMNLEPSTTYYVWAYAINVAGTGYGQRKHFTTKDLEPVVTAPEVVTRDVTDVTSTSAIFHGEVINDGGANIVEKGFCYREDGVIPEITDHPIPCIDGTELFEKLVTDLLPGTTYIVRAYARNSVEIGYGDTVLFQTIPEVVPSLPEVTIDTVYVVSFNKVRCEGNVIDEGSSGVFERGVCWSNHPNPTIDDHSQQDTTGGSGPFILDVRLSPFPQTYYFKTYAKNSAGIKYSEREIEYSTEWIKNADSKQ